MFSIIRPVNFVQAKENPLARVVVVKIYIVYAANTKANTHHDWIMDFI